MAAGYSVSCGRKGDGSVVCWGLDTMLDVPDGKYIDITCHGYDDCCALKEDGSIACWGQGALNGATSGTGYTAIALGGRTVCALDGAGNVTCFGEDASLSLPNAVEQISLGASVGLCGVGGDNSMVCSYSTELDGSYVQSANGWHHECALNTEGQVQCSTLGSGFPEGIDDTFGSDVDLIAAGETVVCGVSQSGSISCWGDADVVSAIPSGVYTDIACGMNHCCAVALEGTIDCWGNDHSGTLDAPNP